MKAAVVKAIEANPHLTMRPFSLDNMSITRGPMEREPDTGKWIQPPENVFFGTAVTVQCSPEDREEVIHIFQTLFDPNVPLKDVPHFVTWSFMQDIHEENAEATQDLRDRWIEAVKDHFQLAHHPSKGDKDTRQAYVTWTTSELMDLDTPNPQCDGVTLQMAAHDNDTQSYQRTTSDQTSGPHGDRQKQSGGDMPGGTL